MTLLSTRWFWRFLAEASPRSLRPRRQEPLPMKIEVKRLPDQLWSDLGFPRPCRRDEDHHFPRPLRSL
jgi:hypothetical protein